MTLGYALRYHLPWLVGTLVLALLIAALVTHEQRPTYQATALIQVDATDAVGQGSIDVTSQETRGTQLIQMLEGTPFLSRVCAAESVSAVPCTPGSLQHQVSASLVKSTTMVAVTVTAPRAAWAASLANAVATGAVEQQAQEARQFYAQPIQNRTAQLQQVSAQIAQQEQEIASIAANPALPASEQDAMTAPIYSQLDILQSEYAALTADLQNLQLNLVQDEQSTALAQRAQVPSRPAAPDLRRYLAAAAGAGLVLGFLLMLVAARLDGRVREGQRLAEAAGLPLVFELPRGRSRQATEEACGPAVAALLARQPKARSILLVPADRSTEIGSAAALVGAVMRPFGWDVRVVIEEGLVRPAGDGPARVPELDTVTPVTALQALPAPNSGRHSTGRREVVVFGAAPPQRSELAMLLAPRVDLVVLVASEPRTRIALAQRAAALLRHAGAEIAAGILVCGMGRLPDPSQVAERVAESA